MPIVASAHSRASAQHRREPDVPKQGGLRAILVFGKQRREGDWTDPTAVLGLFSRRLLLLSAETTQGFHQTHNVRCGGCQVGDPGAKKVGCLQLRSTTPSDLEVFSALANPWKDNKKNILSC